MSLRHINTAIWEFGHFVHKTNTPLGWDGCVWTPGLPGQSAFLWQLLSIRFFSYFGFCGTKTSRESRRRQELRNDRKNRTDSVCRRLLLPTVNLHLRSVCQRWRSDWWMSAGKVTVYFMILAFLFCLTCRNKHGTRKAETRGKILY